MFKVDKKKALITRIKLYRERGAVYSEIAKLFNAEGVQTINGGEWETRNLFNFYNRNSEKP